MRTASVQQQWLSLLTYPKACRSTIVIPRQRYAKAPTTASRYIYSCSCTHNVRQTSSSRNVMHHCIPHRYLTIAAQTQAASTAENAHRGSQTEADIPHTEQHSIQQHSEEQMSSTPSSSSASSPSIQLSSPSSSFSSSSSSVFFEMFGSLFLFAQFAGFMYWFKHNVMDLMGCSGPSMLPTMNSSGDLLLIDCFHSPNSYRRGDVVVCVGMNNPGQKVCKRLIGLPFDTIQTRSIIDGSIMSVTIPPGHVWLQGDNLSNSSDSRYYGPVPRAMIVGRVIAKVYPLKEMGWIERTNKFNEQVEVLPAIPTEPDEGTERHIGWRGGLGIPPSITIIRPNPTSAQPAYVHSSPAPSAADNSTDSGTSNNDP